MTHSSSKNEIVLPKKSHFIFLLVFFCFLSFASIVALANDNTVVVETSVLNVRQGPGLSHDVITEVAENDRLQVIDRQNDWIKVRLNDDTVGWVASWLVNQPEIITESQQSAVVTGDYVNIRSQASIDSEILGVVEKDTEVNVVYQDGNWSQIVYEGQVAWISSFYINFVGEDAGITVAPSDEMVVIGELDTNVRVEPTTDSEKIGSATAGESYPYISSRNGWHKIQLDDQTEGYVANYLVQYNGQLIPEDIPEPEAQTQTAISDATIVIDAGHGGHDPGAVTDYIYEKDITLNTALKLQSRLLSSGANVILTRSDDYYVSLGNRVAESRNNQADAFISLHYDAVPVANSMSGTTTYYYSETDSILAEYINQALINNGPLPNNGLREGNLYVLRNNSRPSILLELGYMNNDTDLSMIYTDDYQDTVSDAIYQGLLSYFE